MGDGGPVRAGSIGAVVDDDATAQRSSQGDRGVGWGEAADERFHPRESLIISATVTESSVSWARQPPGRSPLSGSAIAAGSTTTCSAPRRATSAARTRAAASSARCSMSAYSNSLIVQLEPLARLLRRNSAAVALRRPTGTLPRPIPTERGLGSVSGLRC